MPARDPHKRKKEFSAQVRGLEGSENTQPVHRQRTKTRDPSDSAHRLP
jgi:hypothetical protein